MKQLNAAWFLNLWFLLSVTSLMAWLFGDSGGSIWLAIVTPTIVCGVAYLAVRAFELLRRRRSGA